VLGPPSAHAGRGPPDQADLLITTIIILSSAIAGIGGAVLTLHIAANLTGLALVELALELMATLLIAVCSRARANRKYEPGRKTGNRKRLDATRSS
jgi:membrane protein implicated in regulation of membrane protease activity